MQPIYIETPGHTASLTIFKIFDSMENSYASHGSRNFLTKEKKNIYLDNDQSPENFVLSMLKKKETYKTVVGMHGQFEIEMAKLCKSHDIKYFFKTRNPIDQIDSCYNHRCNLLLTQNDPTLIYHVGTVLPILKKLEVPATLANALFTLSVHTIMMANLVALLADDINFIKMESILGSKTDFIKNFEIPEVLHEKIPYFDEKKFNTHSHTKEAKKLSFLKPIKKEILQRYAIIWQGERYQFSDLVALTGYDLYDNLHSNRLN